MSFLSRDIEMQELLGGAGNPGPTVQVIPPAPVGVLPDGGAGGPKAMVGEPYEASSRFDREVALWSPSRRSADGDISGNKFLMDARVRDMSRNDAYSAAGAEIQKDNVVGEMFLVNAKPNRMVLGMDETWEQEFQEEVEAKFTLWAESPNNWVDAQRKNTLTTLVRLALGMHSVSGEILAVGEWISGRPYKTAVQMIDPDRLSTPPYKRDASDMRMGVERDKYGAASAYHIRKVHPFDFSTGIGIHTWQRVPAQKSWGRQQVIHIFEQNRADQSRGIARIVAALKESRITKKYRDIVLQNAVINATYAATIESELPSDVIFSSLGGGQMDPDAVRKAVAGYAGGYMGIMEDYLSSSNNLQIDGARIPHLLPGSKLQMRPAAKGEALGTEFEQSLLRYIAATLGVSYEQLSKDYTQTNYSSARAAMNETHKSMRALKRMTADRFASHIYMWWLEEAIASGEITSMKRGAPNFWDGLNREAYCACDWIGASRGQIDELKETQAAVLRLKYNLTSHEDEIARLGKDYRRVFEQKGREKKAMEKLGIEMVEDSNMMNAASGDTREGEARDEKDDGSEDNTDA